jgi:hypothetical protein
MAVINFADVVKFTAASSGTGDFVVSAAVTGFQTPAAAGMVNGATYRYRAESADLSQWEVGYGVYTSGTVTLARTTVLFSTNANAKVSFTAAPQVGIVYLAEDAMSSQNNLSEVTSKPTAQINIGAREVLTGSRTYYVRSDGSNSNNGSTNSAGGAFLTLAFAYSVVTGKIDFGGQNVTIQMGTNLTDNLNINGAWVGGGILIIDLGGFALTGNNNGVCINCPLPGILRVQNGTITTTAGCSLQCSSPGAILMVNTGMTFGATAASQVQINCVSGGTVWLSGAYTISGGAGYHIVSRGGGSSVAQTGAFTITLTGTPAFTLFVVASRLGLIDIESGVVTFSGAATGQRYSMDTNAVIYTNAGGANYFPGNAAGPASPNFGGIYI